eukprot:12144374-Prorocentrum_lima.AAC.1
MGSTLTMSDKLASKEVLKCREVLKARYIELGCRLKTLKVTDDGINWQRTGVFSVVDCKHVQHCSGKQVEVPEGLTLSDSAVVESNWSEDDDELNVGGGL